MGAAPLLGGLEAYRCFFLPRIFVPSATPARFARALLLPPPTIALTFPDRWGFVKKRRVHFLKISNQRNSAGKAAMRSVEGALEPHGQGLSNGATTSNGNTSVGSTVPKNRIFFLTRFILNSFSD